MKSTLMSLVLVTLLMGSTGCVGYDPVKRVNIPPSAYGKAFLGYVSSLNRKPLPQEVESKIRHGELAIVGRSSDGRVCVMPTAAYHPQYYSVIDGINGELRKQGYHPVTSGQGGWNNGNYVAVGGSYSTGVSDYTYVGYNANGLPMVGGYDVVSHQLTLGAEASVNFRGQGINWQEKYRRENHPKDGIYEGVLRKSKSKKK